MNPRPPLPPFTEETARQKVQAAEDAWNSRDPERVALAYTEDTHWRNRTEFIHGRAAVVEFLKGRPEVISVIHPSVQTGEARARADKYLSGGLGGLVGFELAGGREAGRRFIDALELFYHVANIGDARSLAIHPASTTHSQLSAEEQLASGVTDGYVRLSIGLEHIDDILADLDAALNAAKG